MKTQKDYKTILVEYCTSLSDDELKLLASNLNERYQDDLAEALDCMSKKPQIDNILASARSAEELYQLCDVIGDLILREAKKRKVSLWSTADTKKRKTV